MPQQKPVRGDSYSCRYRSLVHGNEQPDLGRERIADELLLKIGIRISPRTVRRYMPKPPQCLRDPRQRWLTFVRNHARAIIAYDFFVVDGDIPVGLCLVLRKKSVR